MNGFGDWVSQWWPLVATAVTLLGICVTIYIFRRNRKILTLDYEILGDLSVTGFGRTGLGSKVEMSYNGTKIENPRVVTVRVYNSGTEPVEREDFTKRINITLTGSTVIDAFAQRESSEGMVKSDAAASPQVDISAIDVDLMNKSDHFTIQILCDGKPDEIKVTCRFKGQAREMSASPDALLADEIKNFRQFSLWNSIFVAVLLLISVIVNQGFVGGAVLLFGVTWIFVELVLVFFFLVGYSTVRRGRYSSDLLDEL